MTLTDLMRGIVRAINENGGVNIDAYAIPPEDWDALRKEVERIARRPALASAKCDRPNFLVGGIPVIMAEPVELV